MSPGGECARFFYPHGFDFQGGIEVIRELIEIVRVRRLAKVGKPWYHWVSGNIYVFSTVSTRHPLTRVNGQSVGNKAWSGIEVVITGLTRNQVIYAEN